MRKIKTKIKINIVTYTNVCKTTRLTIDNWLNKTINIINSNKNAEINYINIKLAKFEVYIIIFLASKTYCK